MTSIDRELRLAGIIGLLLTVYGGAIAALAVDRGQAKMLLPGMVSEILASIWIAAFAFVFIAYALELMLHRRPEHPLKVMASEFRENVLRPDWLIARAGVVLGWYVMMLFFTPMKVMIGHIQGFPLDQGLMLADRALFLGHDPWRLTHALLGGPVATFALQFAYNVWFVLMWLTVIYAMMRPERVGLRARYIVSFLLCWILVGSLAAYVLASAGPCYYERALGDAHYRSLMDQLHVLDLQIRAMNPGFGVWALDLQDMLWNAFVAKTEIFGGGISAMPSMHVSLATLMALGARSLDRRLGWAMVAYAIVIWIGSVHLGWHYAVDGIVAFVMTLGIWRLSGWLVERFVLAESGRRARAILA